MVVPIDNNQTRGECYFLSVDRAMTAAHSLMKKSGNIQKLGNLKGSLVRWLLLDGREPCSGELNGSLPQRR